MPCSRLPCEFFFPPISADCVGSSHKGFAGNGHWSVPLRNMQRTGGPRQAINPCFRDAITHTNLLKFLHCPMGPGEGGKGGEGVTSRFFSSFFLPYICNVFQFMLITHKCPIATLKIDIIFRFLNNFSSCAT